jgi:phosphoglucosamine mutase
VTLFGTDGIRGRFPEPPLNPETARALGACLVARFGGPLPIVRDTRESGPALLAALVEGAGGAAVDLGVLPTPALSAALAAGPARVGVAVTASHNPWHDNGLKVAGEGGGKLTPDEEAAVEADLQRALVEGPPAVSGGALAGAGWSFSESDYLDALLACLPADFSLAGVTVALDCAHGAAWRTAPAALARLGARVVAVGVAPDGRNINAGVGALHPESVAAAVVESGAQVGIALDGDGDRCALVDAGGRPVDGDALLWLLARPPGLVGTVMCNGALEARLKAAGVGFARAPVGDRNVALEMAARGWPVGGEPSGHALLAEGLPTGDGLLTALTVLAGGLDLAGRLAGWALYPQHSTAVRVAARPPLADFPAVAAAEAAARAGGATRVVLRYSGTEPKLRVLVEAPDAALARALNEALTAATLAAIGQG